MGETRRKPTKNQGENQGSRKPSVLVGFLRQKKGLCIPSRVRRHHHHFLKAKPFLNEICQDWRQRQYFLNAKHFLIEICQNLRHDRHSLYDEHLNESIYQSLTLFQLYIYTLNDGKQIVDEIAWLSLDEICYFWLFSIYYEFSDLIFELGQELGANSQDVVAAHHGVFHVPPVGKRSQNVISKSFYKLSSQNHAIKFTCS